MAAAYVLLENDVNRRALRRKRVFRDRNDPFNDLDDSDLMSKYRLPQHLIVNLCNSLQNRLTRNTERNHAMSVSTQVFAALRYYASGCFFLDTAGGHGISKSLVSRALHDVNMALCDHVREYIQFPRNLETLRIIKNHFYEIANFPKVIGLVDGTQIPIKGPSQEELLYICLKGFHSLSVQLVCSASLKILDIVSKWPGSTHDAFVWANCGLNRLLEEGQMSGFILGDSGYPLRPYLMTPS